MSLSRCRVSYIDNEGVGHAVDVQAESLYEAVALAASEFGADALNTSKPGPATEFTVTVFRTPTEHRVCLKQVANWAEHTTREGPAGVTKRQRVRELLARH
jgi:hypothetical protein